MHVQVDGPARVFVQLTSKLAGSQTPSKRGDWTMDCARCGGVRETAANRLLSSDTLQHTVSSLFGRRG